LFVGNLNLNEPILNAGPNVKRRKLQPLFPSKSKHECSDYDSDAELFDLNDHTCALEDRRVHRKREASPNIISANSAFTRAPKKRFGRSASIIRKIIRFLGFRPCVERKS
jgi:hypothetical protein